MKIKGMILDISIRHHAFLYLLSKYLKQHTLKTAMLKQQGITILVSTPYMDEASLCDRIALILNGEFMQIDTPQNIIDAFPDTLWSVQTDETPKLLKTLRNNLAIKSAYSFGDSIHITMKKGYEVQGTEYKSFKKIEPTIEDCFMLLSKQQNDGK
jgi:ABC-type multidrug transport system ATPase subunit